MRFRFGEGEELMFVSTILPQLSDIEEEEEESCGRCPSPSSVDSTAKHCPSRGAHWDGALITSKPTSASRAKLLAKRKLERLRREITTLGVELARLSETKGADSSKQRYTRSRWKTLAETRLQQRQRAERDNKKLKRMITAQHLLAKSLINGQADRLRAKAKARRALHSSRTRSHPCTTNP